MSETYGTNTLGRIVDGGIIGIVRLPFAGGIVETSRALRQGGIDVCEIAMTTPDALDSIRSVAKELGESLVIGAGTVLDPETARAAILAGAQFVVTPVLQRATIRACRRYGVVAIPGAYTPTEILTASEWGADLVKVFPASSLGPRYFRDVLAPLPSVRLVPTGGVDLETAGAYISAGAQAIAVGSSLVNSRIVLSRDFDRIATTAHQFRVAVDEARARLAVH